MARLTFNVCMSSLAANTAPKQNTLGQQQEYPEAGNTGLVTFYVDDGLVSPQFVDSAISLQEELQCLSAGRFWAQEMESQW